MIGKLVLLVLLVVLTGNLKAECDLRPKEQYQLAAAVQLHTIPLEADDSARILGKVVKCTSYRGYVVVVAPSGRLWFMDRARAFQIWSGLSYSPGLTVLQMIDQYVDRYEKFTQEELWKFFGRGPFASSGEGNPARGTKRLISWTDFQLLSENEILSHYDIETARRCRQMLESRLYAASKQFLIDNFDPSMVVTEYTVLEMDLLAGVSNVEIHVASKKVDLSLIRLRYDINCDQAPYVGGSTVTLEK